MTTIEELDRIAINVKSHRLLRQLLEENPKLEEIMQESRNETEALVGVRNWVMGELRTRPEALAFYRGERTDRESFEALRWRDYAAIRILDYIDNAGLELPDFNLRGQLAVTNPIKLVWLAVHRGTGGAKPFFFEDMLELFRQFSGTSGRPEPGREQVEAWMDRFSSGLDPRIIELRRENRERILNVIIDRIDRGEIGSARFRFDPGMTRAEKFARALEWWNDTAFHLRFAVRSPDLLNEMLGYSLDPDTMQVLHEAREAGIPFFVNPYYLSLLHVRVPYFARGGDLAIRHYVLYSQQLVDEFGHIVAWEKEDQVRPGKPNVAGWLLPPYDNVHRRYPDVAILIPDTTGRACGGLCASCQRMYDFQRGRLNFDLEKLEPKETWANKLCGLMKYFEEDSQLRDILVTGGDALMSSDRALETILDAIYDMALAKKKANRLRADGEKYAEIVRIRLGTRLLAYLPQRITRELVELLTRFRERARKIGIRQFVIQAHFESAMEVTPEARDAIRRLQTAGWIITNQLVFTTAASRRGHSAKLRQVLCDVGVLPYYTFAVKGFMENQFNYAPIARLVQEELEEKAAGRPPDEYMDVIRSLPDHPHEVAGLLDQVRHEAGLPFVSTDRSVLNLPGVGKSLTFRVIGITRYGRRILEFHHDRTREHSPIINEMGRVLVIESKSISEALRQLDDMGEDLADYEGVWGYSMGETEPRMPIYEYPGYAFEITKEITNLELAETPMPSSDASSRTVRQVSE